MRNTSKMSKMFKWLLKIRYRIQLGLDGYYIVYKTIRNPFTWFVLSDRTFKTSRAAQKYIDSIEI